MEYLNLLSVVAFSYFSSGLTLSAYEFECTECRQHNFSFFIISNFSHFRISPFYSGCYQTNQANIIPTACKSLFCVKLFSAVSSSLNTMPFRDAETTWFVRCCFFFASLARRYYLHYNKCCCFCFYCRWCFCVLHEWINYGFIWCCCIDNCNLPSLAMV